jgi:hypothetical protein
MHQNAHILGYDMSLFDIIKFCITKPLIIQAPKYSLNSGMGTQRLSQVKDMKESVSAFSTLLLKSITYSEMVSI